MDVIPGGLRRVRIKVLSTKTLDREIPGFFVLRRRNMETVPACGCDCDHVPVEPGWHMHLTEDDPRRMVEEKIARARRQRDMMARINGQSKTD